MFLMRDGKGGKPGAPSEEKAFTAAFLSIKQSGCSNCLKELEKYGKIP
jgi:hypothetical protein